MDPACRDWMGQVHPQKHCSSAIVVGKVLAVCFAIVYSSPCVKIHIYLHAISFALPNDMRVLYTIPLVVQDGWKSLFDFLCQFRTKILTCFFLLPVQSVWRCKFACLKRNYLVKNMAFGINMYLVTSCEESTGPPLVWNWLCGANGTEVAGGKRLAQKVRILFPVYSCVEWT